MASFQSELPSSSACPAVVYDARAYSAEQPRIARRGGAGPKRPQLQTLVYAQKLVKFSNLATLDSYYVHLCPN